MAARCVTGGCSPTCAVHIENCEGWWLSGRRSSVVEHWWLKPELSWVQLPAAAGLLYFCFITFISSMQEARCSGHHNVVHLITVMLKQSRSPFLRSHVFTTRFLITFKLHYAKSERKAFETSLHGWHQCLLR